jgi:ribosomal protein S27E
MKSKSTDKPYTIEDKLKEYTEAVDDVILLVECPNCDNQITTNARIQVICPDCGFPVKLNNCKIIDCCSQDELDLLYEMEEIKNGRIILH